MATTGELLAVSLEALSSLQATGRVAIRSADLSRTDRERLVAAGYLRRVLRGWYVATRPDVAPGDTTPWYASYWDFVRQYLDERFGAAWSLSPEDSIGVLAGNRTIPELLNVRCERGGNTLVELLHGHRIYLAQTTTPRGADRVERDGVPVFAAAPALCLCSPALYRQREDDVRAVLYGLSDASDVLEYVLRDGKSTVAGRLIGAFEANGQRQHAEQMRSTLRDLGYEIRVTVPFESPEFTSTYAGTEAPAVRRLRLLWERLREPVLATFPPAASTGKTAAARLAQIDARSTSDAYHSLSIEGYAVDAALIERVRAGDWSPEDSREDAHQRDALAARGYYDASQRVRSSVAEVLDGASAAAVAQRDHGAWYRALFSPSVAAGLLPSHALAGYRSAPVYLRGSRHVPPSAETARACMPAFFELLDAEEAASVRAVLGHFLFGYIHPYPDGNGRMARFLMNLMLTSGGYPWVVIPVTERARYMSSLEAASVDGDIGPFAEFIAELVRKDQVPPVP